jgi:polyisoprenoid-binding protein YceI
MWVAHPMGKGECALKRFGRGLCLYSLLIVIPAVSIAQVASKAGSPIDTERSTMTIKVSKSGVFSFAGDDHEIRAPISRGSVNEKERTVELTIDARKLVVIDPKLSPEKRAEVQNKMLSADVLDPERFPSIEFIGDKVEQKSGDELLVHGKLSLHGTQRPVNVKVTGKQPHYKGSAVMKQTDFGMKPVSAGGGTVKVKDEVTIEFEIVTK